MILTVTCNPAIDKTYSTSSLMMGHVNRMRDFVSLPGGKGINVTKVLRQFGEDVTATGFLGGYTGEFINDELIKMRVETAFIGIRGTTRSNMNVIGDDGYVTEILEPGPKIYRHEQDAFLDQFKELTKEHSIVAISGSLSEGLPNDFYAKMIAIAKENGAKVFLDSSGEPLKLGIAAAPYCVKPNRAELEYVAGKKLISEADIIQAAYEFIKNGVTKVVVSLGEKGLLQITKNKVIKAVPPKIKAVNTVGCGDSVVAALLLGESRYFSEEDTVRFAAGVSAANAMTMESGMIPQEVLDEITEKVIVVSA